MQFGIRTIGIAVSRSHTGMNSNKLVTVKQTQYVIFTRTRRRAVALVPTDRVFDEL